MIIKHVPVGKPKQTVNWAVLFQNKWFWAIMVLIALMIFGYMSHQKTSSLENYNPVRATSVASDLFNRPLELAKAANTDLNGARDLQNALVAAREGSLKPSSTEKVQAATIEEAAQIVSKAINEKAVDAPVGWNQQTWNEQRNKDSRQWDSTLVVADTKTQDVKVFNNRFDRTVAIGAGVGVHEGDVYIPVSYAHAYQKNRSFRIAVHLDAEDLAKKKVRVNGGEITHEWRY